MDKRIKYSLKQKQAVVKAVISGVESCNSAARRIGTDPTTVKRWVNLYNYQGIDGLKPRNSIYNGKFKIEVIRYMLKNQLSLTKTAALFGISHDQIIPLWLSTSVKKDEKLVALQREIEYLCAENAFLKKLDALIQKERLAQAQGKRPRPSRS